MKNKYIQKKKKKKINSDVSWEKSYTKLNYDKSLSSELLKNFCRVL